FGRARADAVIYAAVANQIERGDALGDARRMVDVGRHLDDAVPDANVLGPLAAGCQKDLGRGGVCVFFEEMMLRGPDVIEPAAVGEFDFIERVLEQRMLGILRPRPGELMFVKPAKFHSYECTSRSNGLRASSRTS